MDDAVHIKRSTTSNVENCWEVGVHIADVAFFVKHKTELDKWAQERGTSVYLVQKVILIIFTE